MNIEEKLQHFTKVILEGVNEECEKSLAEYKKELDWKFETHKEQHLKEAKVKENALRDAVEKKTSKEYTMEQLHIKRKINHKQNEIKAKLFAQVEEELKKFRETEEYRELLVREIKSAIEFAGKSALIVYVGVDDEELAKDLSKMLKVPIEISDNITKGGMRAEIPRKNILIDNTFETKISEAKEKFLILEA